MSDVSKAIAKKELLLLFRYFEIKTYIIKLTSVSDTTKNTLSGSSDPTGRPYYLSSHLTTRRECGKDLCVISLSPTYEIPLTT